MLFLRRVAQFGLGHLLWEQEVVGSNPSTPTKIKSGGEYCGPNKDGFRIIFNFASVVQRTEHGFPKPGMKVRVLPDAPNFFIISQSAMR